MNAALEQMLKNYQVQNLYDRKKLVPFPAVDRGSAICLLDNDRVRECLLDIPDLTGNALLPGADPAIAIGT